MPGSEVKKYIVRLTMEQRELLEALIGDGRHRRAQILKARVLLKADVAGIGKGWSDGRIIRALHTSRSTVFRTRRRLIEEGFEAVLTRRYTRSRARFVAGSSARFGAESGGRVGAGSDSLRGWPRRA